MHVPRLHAPTDDRIAAAPDLVHRVQTLARPGVALHARTGADGRRFLQLADVMRQTAREGGAAFFVNDRADIARLAEADGLHLPAEGLSVAAARGLLGRGRLIGRSAHNAAEALRARDEGADYVFLGPIWPTASHPRRRALGLDAIRDARGVTVIAVGGVTPARVAQCLDAGAYGVAAIRALWDAADPASTARAMLLSLGEDITT